MKVALGIECEGTAHLIELHDDGTAVMLDHNEKTLRSFVAFDAPMPACLRAVGRWRVEPVNFLLTTGALDVQTQGLLGCDFVERVVGLIEQYLPPGASGWSLVDHALEAARESFFEPSRRYEATAYRGQVRQKADLLAARARMGKGIGAVGASRAADALEAIIDAAGSWDERFARQAIELAASRAADVAFRARQHDLGYEERVAAEKRERKWQMQHAIKVLVALRDDEPWPKVEPIEVES